MADRAARVGRFLWSGWAGLAGLALLAALWQAGHEAYGDFILPSPLATLAAAWGLLGDPAAWAKLWLTTERALLGFGLVAGMGVLTGLAGGYQPATLRLARPLLTVMLGVPPIASIVLAMIWFGASNATVAATILIAATPVVFVGAADGVATRDRGLDAMAEAFGADPLRRLWHVSARQIAALVFPALALGTAFKVAVMAELLANAGGIGGELAGARAMLDISLALAWVLLAVAALVCVEYGLIRPVRAELERWREAAQP